MVRIGSCRVHHSYQFEPLYFLSNVVEKIKEKRVSTVKNNCKHKSIILSSKRLNNLRRYMNQNDKKICQSCGMPLEKEEQFGTNIDESKNKEYCIYCYKYGKFTDLDITMDQMINKCVGIMVKMKNMPLEKAKSILENVIPNLKRWKK